MCGRYLTPDEAAFERFWGIRPPPDFKQSYNVAPSQSAPILRYDDRGELCAASMTWGFEPGWARRAWINARSETVFESRAFADSARRHRCLVPAMGWYEWQGAKAPKQPHVLHRAGFVPFAFAGIWTARNTANGWIRSFAIVTQPALETISEIHDRMPVVVEPGAYTDWAGPDADRARSVLAGQPGGIETYPVSQHVNKPQNDDPSCIAPIS